MNEKLLVLFLLLGFATIISSLIFVSIIIFTQFVYQPWHIQLIGFIIVIFVQLCMLIGGIKILSIFENMFN
jgi:hypothetical protein